MFLGTDDGEKLSRKIAFLVPYYGKWPVWFPAFLASCKTNPTINWFFFTDISLPEGYPNNVEFHHLSLQDIQKMASVQVGFEVALTHPYKLCDLKPAYGDIFKKYITSYDFWGFCDIDIVWGNIRHFINEADLERFDVITAMEEKVAGHFTLIRNSPQFIGLYQQTSNFKTIFMDPVYRWFDEHEFSNFLKELYNLRKLRIGWQNKFLSKGIVSPSHLDYLVDRYLYEDGRLFELDANLNKVKEYLYLHFISWKRTLRACKVDENASSFFVSYDIIQPRPSGKLKKLFNPVLRMVWGYPQRVRYAMWKRKVIKIINHLKSSEIGQ